MHEIAMASKVLREAIKAGATKLIKVNVGELCEILPEELEYALKKLTSVSQNEEEFLNMNSVMKNDKSENINLNEDLVIGSDWDVEVNFVKSKIECYCGYNGEANIIERGHGYCLFNCPSCFGKPEVAL